MITAPVNKIIDCSVVDGPGNTTAIFFQGCNFNCIYCHNPETINICRNCGSCASSCPTGAISTTPGEKEALWNESLCAGCDNCIKVCPHGSSPKIRNISVDEAVLRVAGNIPFIRGVTCSGGECTLQKEFIVPFFERVRALGLRTLLDSNGSLDFSLEPELMAVTDGVMLDVKSADPLIHLSLTGMSNSIVLKNIDFLAEQQKLIELRIVVADEPGFHSRETVDAVSRRLQASPNGRDAHFRIIAFRPFGVRKQFQSISPPSPRLLRELERIARGNGMKYVSIT
ncbi:MAG: YjjW family glycine radical enzyme activase [Clostridiales bacterium]|jgi:pyruvate formate lyase activating enzyme|nr:YjjW family glycine radical enzyme activase [Clostridiales bacterium]